MSIMQEKTAYLISCSDHFSHRLNVAHDHLRARGYRVQYITSDFDHVKKVRFTCDVPDCVQIPAKPYRKNLSVSRILSHYCFARDVFRYLESLSQEPDVILALIPPNFLAHYAAKYKKAHPNVRLIFDIFDMWPEALPVKTGNPVIKFALSIWGAFRNRNLKHADKIYTECDYYQEILEKEGYTMPMETKYLSQEDGDLEIKGVWKDDQIHICYVGSINNIINAPLMIATRSPIAK